MNPNKCSRCGLFLSPGKICECSPTLGMGEAGPLVIDVDALMAGKLLVTAQSGGGKSWATRRILEQLYGQVPILILDREGEFFTLRERFDFLLVGDAKAGADIQIRLDHSDKVARRMLDVNCSAVIDLEPLPSLARFEYVRRFLAALIDAPKTERPHRAVVIDEAHVWVPQTGKPDSKGRLLDLASLGRKRGLVAFFATQRLAKFAKDAAAECQNVLVGPTTLDSDVKRAADSLGLSGKYGRAELKNLVPGTFYAYGPAFEGGLQKVQIGPVQTTHPRPGEKLPDVQPLTPRGSEILESMSDKPIKFGVLHAIASKLKGA